MKSIAICAFAILSASFLVEAKEIKFESKKIQIGNVSVTAEIADTPEKSAQGLMFRQKLEEGHGMLFVFHSQEQRTFWMKNTFIPLSIGFFNSKKTLVDIQDMSPVKSEMQTDLPIYASKGPAQYALEVPQGWFKKHKVKIGDKLSGD